MSYYTAGYTNPATQTILVGAREFEVENATTNAITNVVTIRHLTTGTAADGIGAGLLFQDEDDGGTAENAGRISGVLTTAASGSEASALVFESRTGGGALREVVRFGPAAAVFNEDGIDYDFRFEGGTNANLLQIDAGLDSIGMGAAAAAAIRLNIAFGTLAIAADVLGRFVSIQPVLTEASSGTHAALIGLDIAALSVTSGNAAVTDAATLRVAGAANATGANNYALWVDAGQSGFPTGTAAAPSIVAEGDLDTGIYFPAANAVGIAAGGVEIARFQPATTGGGWVVMDEADSDPGTGVLDSLDSFATYMKNNKLVLAAYNYSGTIFYVTLLLDTTTTTLVHNSTAP